MRRLASVLAIVVTFTQRPLSAQLPTGASDMLRRLYASRDFALQPFGPARWRDGGAAYTTVEPSATTPGASDIVRYETATGAKRVMVTARQLVPAGAATPDIDDYDWSVDDSVLLVFTNTQRVWRRNTRGDYWV
jgi:dipeptidyl-peptidase-4